MRSLSPGFNSQPPNSTQPTEIESNGLISRSRRYDLSSFSPFPRTNTATTLSAAASDGLLTDATMPSVGIWDLRKLTWSGGGPALGGTTAVLQPPSPAADNNPTARASATRICLASLRQTTTLGNRGRAESVETRRDCRRLLAGAANCSTWNICTDEPGTVSSSDAV